MKINVEGSLLVLTAGLFFVALLTTPWMYIPMAILAYLAGRKHIRGLKPIVLESLGGVIDEIDNETVYVTLTGDSGERMEGQYQLSDWHGTNIPCEAGQTFTVRTLHMPSGEVKVEMKPA